MKIEIGSVVFANVSNGVKFIRQWIDELGESTIGHEHPRFRFLSELLKRHPAYKEVHPVNFYIQPNAFGQLELAFGTFGFGRTAFSFSTCVRGKLKNNKLERAMRSVVVGQVYNIVSNGFCELCSDVIGDSITHVDHIEPFVELKKKFLESWPDRIPSEFISRSDQGGHIEFHKDDIDFKDAWIKFHFDNATLRVVHAKCNLSRKRKPPPGRGEVSRNGVSNQISVDLGKG